MTTSSPTHSFVTTVTGKQRNRSNTGWAVTLDWCLPGSQYPFILYMQDDDHYAPTVAEMNINESFYLTLERGSLKQGKDGSKEYDYFWNLATIGPAQDAPATATESTHSPQTPRGDVDTRIAWNSAINNAVHCMGMDGDLVENREQWLAGVRTLAGEIYAMITAGPPAGAVARIPKDAIEDEARRWNEEYPDRALTPRMLNAWALDNYGAGYAELSHEQAISMCAAIANGEVAPQPEPDDVDELPF